MCREICVKLENGDYDEEVSFVEALEEEEVDYLETILQRELDYAAGALDDVRVKELEAIYEVLF